MTYRDSYPPPSHIGTQTASSSSSETYSQQYYQYYPQQYYGYYNNNLYNVYGPPSTPSSAQYAPPLTTITNAQTSATPFTQHPPPTNEEAVNLFINYLVPTITSEDLENLFSRFGEIESCKVMVNLDTGLSKGFGFVKYRSPDSAKQALQEMNGAEVQGKQIQVKVANTQGEIKRPRLAVSTQTSSTVPATQAYGSAIIAPVPPGFGYPYPITPYPHLYSSPPLVGAPALAPLGTDPTNLYVNNLPIDANDEMLIKLFQPYGAIQSAKVIKDPVTNQSRGYGFVRMGTQREASAAIKGVSGLLLEGQAKPLTVQFKLNKSG